MNKTKLLIATLAISTVMATTALAGEWKQDQTGWWYQNDNGSYPTNTWLLDNEKWYCFDENGYMRTGWVQTVDGKWYYLNSTGAMQIDQITLDDGITYNFAADGSCINRWAGATDSYYYDVSEGRERSIGAILAERDYLNNIGGGSGSMFGDNNSSNTPDMTVDLGDQSDEEENDEDY